MKQYGNGMKATEFSKKQINVLYGMAKRGEIKVERWYMHDLYDMADYYGYDYNGSIAFEERFILNILDAAFNHSDDLQQQIDRATEYCFSCYTVKAQKAFDREYIH